MHIFARLKYFQEHRSFINQYLEQVNFVFIKNVFILKCCNVNIFNTRSYCWLVKKKTSGNYGEGVTSAHAAAIYTTYGMYRDFNWLSARDCRCSIPTAMLNSVASPTISYKMIFIGFQYSSLSNKSLYVKVRTLSY